MELAGDFFKKRTFPKIRLQGKWLAALGFKATGRVAIVPITEGTVLLKFIDPQPAGSALNDTPDQHSAGLA